MESNRVDRKLAALLSADVVGYSRLMARDEVATLKTLNAHRAVMGDLVGRYGGRVVNAVGDNLLAEFGSVVDAVACAIAIQDQLGARNADLPAEAKMEFRIGVHLGDVMVEGEDVYGDGVNIAARLEALAEPGGICISATVYEQVRRKLECRFEDLGEQMVKNIPDPVRVYRVRKGEDFVAERPRTKPRLQPALVVGLTVLLGAVAWAGWRILAPDVVQRASTPSRAPIESLAVLPLDNFSADPEQQYFADGMTEALISDIARIASLRVISRTSVMQYKEARQPISEIARDLDVDAIIEGSVFRAGETVRITVQLIDARRDQHLWSQSYQRELRDVLRVQSEVAQAVAHEVDATLTPQEQARLRNVGPVHPEAYQAYLKGKYFFQKDTPSDHRLALEYFEEAIRLDPDYAAAYAALADAYT
ncbi:MAG: adenylate/guanylate cyclase domain-containing protein [Candidatus Krumholzibacteriia bacterium]